jgi:homocysteine S-methyltransferase
MTKALKMDMVAALQERVLVFDGAMGTEIYRRHVYINRNFEELSVSEPALVRQIHQDYADAGADVLTANSYGANREALARFGFAEKTAAINRAAAELACEVARGSKRQVFVAGSVGPISQPGLTAARRIELLAEQIAALAAGGVDGLIFETLPTRALAEAAAAAMQAAGVTLPFIVSFAVNELGESSVGEPVERLMLPFAAGAPAPAAWGLNCGLGPDGLLGAVERAVRHTRTPVIVEPNAGLPKEVDNRRINLCSPEYLATYAKRYLDLGARGVGGCCGTTPDHIREVARALRPLAQQRIEIKAVPTETIALKPAVPLAGKTGFSAKLARGAWVTSIELVPPRGYNLADVVAKALLCKAAGIDAINIPDGPRASARISPLITALEIQVKAGIEAMLHVCARDRNIISLQADLLGCAAVGLQNLLFITGDPPKLGPYPSASGVFDVDAIGLVRLQARLNRGVDLGGQGIDPQTRAVIGVGADPNALDFDREVRRFREKVEAGAEFAITQPVFAAEPLFRFLDAIADLKLPVLAGVWPLASYRNAQFMKNEVPGVVVPDELLTRMGAVEGRDDQRKIGIEIAREMVAKIRHRLAGLQVSAPMGNVATALAVLAP